MPPRKQPKSLRDLCLKTVARLANESCVNIERKHGGFKCQASRDQLDICKTYLSSVQHLLDEIRKIVLETCLQHKNGRMRRLDEDVSVRYQPHPVVKGPDDKYLILDLLMSNTTKELDLHKLHVCNKCFTNSVFWTKQLLKMKYVVILDIQDVLLTDESFQAIGDVCTNIRKLYITSDLEYAPMKSLNHILKCQKLQEVNVNFLGWADDNRSKYITKLIGGLPQLKYFESWLDVSDLSINISITKTFNTPLLSMRKLVGRSYAKYLTEMVRVFPSITDLTLYPSTNEQNKALRVLEKSSLKLTILSFIALCFNKEVPRVICSKGAHISKLELYVSRGRRISVNDVHTIGLGCPGIVELRFDDLYDSGKARRRFIQLNCPDMEAKTFDTTPPMFTALKVLEVQTHIDWDQRILPLILHHAHNITSISLRDVFKPATTSLDPLTQLLNANALQELESLHIVARWYNGEPCTIQFPAAAIERLLDTCHKLTKFVLLCEMGDETQDYIIAKQEYLEKNNFDLNIQYEAIVD